MLLNYRLPLPLPLHPTVGHLVHLLLPAAVAYLLPQVQVAVAVKHLAVAVAHWSLGAHALRPLVQPPPKKGMKKRTKKGTAAFQLKEEHLVAVPDETRQSINGKQGDELKQ